MKDITTEEIVRAGWSLYNKVEPLNEDYRNRHGLYDGVLGRLKNLLERIEDLKPEEAAIKLYDLYKTLANNYIHQELRKYLLNVLEIPVEHKKVPEKNGCVRLFSCSYKKSKKEVDALNQAADQKATIDIDRRIAELKQQLKSTSASNRGVVRRL